MCTVEMLRATWEKTSNPYIRFATKMDRPRVGIRRRIFLSRPKDSTYSSVQNTHGYARDRTHISFWRVQQTYSCVDLLCWQRARTVTANRIDIGHPRRWLYLYESRAPRGTDLEVDHQNWPSCSQLGLWKGQSRVSKGLKSWLSLTLPRAQAPEYPWPWAIDEAYDAYKQLHAAKGKNIGMSGDRLSIVLTGDSA